MGVSIIQSSAQAPFTSEIVGSFWTHSRVEKSDSIQHLQQAALALENIY